MVRSVSKTINRKPPPVTSAPLPAPLAPTIFENGRIGWPSVFQYQIIADDGAVRVADYPPTEKAIREPSKPSPVPKMIQPRTERYSIVVHDQAAYKALSKSGALHDPRHIGGDITQAE